MGKAKKTTAKEPDVFKREVKTFQVMGQNFQMEFIPSEHFMGFFSDVMAFALDVLLATPEGKEEETVKVSMGFNFNKMDAEKLTSFCQKVLREGAFDLLRDILVYQNDEPKSLTVEELKKRTSAVEMARFLSMLMTDEEVMASAQEFLSGLGKLIGDVTGKLPKTT